MKMTVIFNSGETSEIEISNQPTLEFEQIDILLPAGEIAHTPGFHKWLPLTSDQDLSQLVEQSKGQAFELLNDTWQVIHCFVMTNGHSIFYRQAFQISNQHASIT